MWKYVSCCPAQWEIGPYISDSTPNSHLNKTITEIHEPFVFWWISPYMLIHVQPVWDCPLWSQVEFFNYDVCLSLKVALTLKAPRIKCIRKCRLLKSSSANNCLALLTNQCRSKQRGPRYMPHDTICIVIHF